MKRRKFLLLGGLSGLGLGLGGYCYLSTQKSAGASSDSRFELAQTPQTVASPFPLWRFVALGDVGTGNRGQYAVAQTMNSYFQQHPFSLILLTGDNIYPNGEIEKIGAAFESPYRFLRQRAVPFYAVLGNHDVRTNNGADEIRYPGLNMQGRYYTFSKGPVQFFALDTNKQAAWKEQLIWLEENLARSPATWKIVFGHHPVYSSGVHGDTPRLKELPSLFSRYRVQLYLSGHDHNYERTQPLQGTTYLVCGAGAQTRPVGSSDWTAYAKARLSFAAIEVYPNRLEVAGIGRNGQVFDRAEITNA